MQLFVGDIPLDDISELYVAVDLIGPGRIWVDDVRVLKSQLQPEERVYLRGQVLVARERLAQGNPFPAENLLDSKWGRYMLHRTHAFAPAIPFHMQAPGDAPQENEAWNNSKPILQRWGESFRDRWQR